MLGLFGTLNMGARSLQAQQAGVALAGQNLSNINNPGYARQRLVLQTSPTIDARFGPQGTGLGVGGIQQVRDGLLDALVRDELSVGAYWTTQQNALQTAQSALNEFLNLSASGVTNPDASSADVSRGLGARITSFFNAFQGLAATPSSLEARQEVVSQAAFLTEAFQQTQSRLDSVASMLDKTVVGDVQKANDLLAQIADLNADIAAAETPGGGAANDLRDIRLQKIEELSKIVSIETTAETDGTITIAIGGTPMLQGRDLASRLETFESGAGFLLVRAEGAETALSLSGGSLEGAISTRDGALRELRAGVDLLATGLIQEVNTIYREGYDLNGNTGADFFTGNDASTVRVSKHLNSNPAALQAAGVSGAPGDNSVALRLARLGVEASASFGGVDIGEAYRSLVTDFGHSLWNASQQVANHEAVSALLSAQRDSVSGVSMEEEMTSLMTYQKAYQASAKLITTVDQMLETLIAMKR
jgi:flagellar hook-associated protein 1 FlgK